MAFFGASSMISRRYFLPLASGMSVKSLPTMEGLMGQHDAGLDVAHVDVERALQVVGILGADLLSRASLPLALMKAAPFSAMAMASFSVGSAGAGEAELAASEGGERFSWGGSWWWIGPMNCTPLAGRELRWRKPATFPWVS
jgi:hypothetical protein